MATSATICETTVNLTSNAMVTAENIRNATATAGVFSMLGNTTTGARVAAGNLFQRCVAAVQSFIPSSIARLGGGIFRFLESSLEFIFSHWDLIAGAVSIVYAIQVALERDYVRRELRAIRRAENALGLAILAINGQIQGNHFAEVAPAVADENAAAGSDTIHITVPHISGADVTDTTLPNVDSEIIEPMTTDNLSNPDSETEH
ncbi:MAG: hypothetical protein LBI81_00335 [Puniceicoccales bacterium]|nr:hypothetical protein [Puniceicoccales bacterium]